MEEVIAKNLIKLLKLNNLTQKQLAEKLDIKLQVVNRWVNGKALPTTKSLDKLASVFGVPVSYFYNDINNSGIINNGNNNNNSIQNSTINKEIELLNRELEVQKKEIELLKEQMKVWKIGYVLQEQKKRGKK